MPDPATIAARILEDGIALVGELVRDSAVDTKFYAFIKASRDSEGRQSPTNYRLRILSDIVLSLGAELVFVLVEDDKQDILANSKAMLMRQYPEFVRNVFPTFGPHGVVIWVEPKRTLSPHDVGLMRQRAFEFLTFLNMPLEAFYVTSSENLPTSTAILKTIRQLAPVPQENLQSELERRKFHIPSDEWLAHTLDKLRKSHFIVRTKAGNYSLSLRGLKALGSGKGRSSPDVIRALAIARRGT